MQNLVKIKIKIIVYSKIDLVAMRIKNKPNMKSENTNRKLQN